MNPHFEDFFSENSAHISDVVSYHLTTEALLERIVIRNLADSTALDFDRMMFAQKLSLVRALGLIERPIHEILRKMNKLRNKFSHEPGYSPSFEDVHALVVEAGRAGVGFTDGIDSPDPSYARSLNYDQSGLLNALFRNVFYEIAWKQGEGFWQEFLA